jgi:hypothetical protein
VTAYAALVVDHLAPLRASTLGGIDGQLSHDFRFWILDSGLAFVILNFGIRLSSCGSPPIQNLKSEMVAAPHTAGRALRPMRSFSYHRHSVAKVR